MVRSLATIHGAEFKNRNYIAPLKTFMETDLIIGMVINSNLDWERSTASDLSACVAEAVLFCAFSGLLITLVWVSPIASYPAFSNPLIFIACSTKKKLGGEGGSLDGFLM